MDTNLHMHLLTRGIPPASGESAKVGWKIDFEFLEMLSNQAYEETGYNATLEVVEYLLLRSVILSAQQPVSPQLSADDVAKIIDHHLRKIPDSARENDWISARDRVVNDLFKGTQNVTG